MTETIDKVIEQLQTHNAFLRNENIKQSKRRNEMFEEIERLKAELVEARRFCICGCPVSEHENYGDEGLGCDNPQHECVLVCAAAAAIADEQRKKIERLKESHRFFHDDVVAAMKALSISIHARPESDHAVFRGEVLPKLKSQAETIERLKENLEAEVQSSFHAQEEIERLKLTLKDERELYADLAEKHERQAAVVEAAIEILETSRQTSRVSRTEKQ